MEAEYFNKTKLFDEHFTLEGDYGICRHCNTPIKYRRSAGSRIRLSTDNLHRHLRERHNIECELVIPKNKDNDDCHFCGRTMHRASLPPHADTCAAARLFYDDRGYSLLYIRAKKGERFVEELAVWNKLYSKSSENRKVHLYRFNRIYFK